MGSRRFGGVRFVVYTNDHHPAHIHAFCDGGEVIVELLADGNVTLADRKDAISRKAKTKTVRKVVDAANEHWAELIELWETHHGSAFDKQTNTESDQSGQTARETRTDRNKRAIRAKDRRAGGNAQ